MSLFLRFFLGRLRIYRSFFVLGFLGGGGFCFGFFWTGNCSKGMYFISLILLLSAGTRSASGI